jgi:hypothetical protein
LAANFPRDKRRGKDPNVTGRIPKPSNAEHAACKIRENESENGGQNMLKKLRATLIQES